ncbi:MAG: substrate-binding domain-containing protein [Prevotella sp.]|nr:substrate-binding domain-containing protein [Bacteroidales bacterium]MCI7654037.1 substrate-binding domain-containing protein [Bacteroidales bacterium]MDY4956724.1 substrate-binding domain-containing protein [Prevotella sp.]
MNKSSFIIVGFTLMTILLAACGNSKQSKDGRTDTPSSGTIGFVSDESFSPIIEEEKEAFLASLPDAHLNPVYSNESDGINQFLSGKCWLVFASRALKPSEVEAMKTQNFLPQSKKIGYDALALIVNKANPDTLISVKDFKDILLGKTTRWSQLGKGSHGGTITVVFDNPKSSTVHYVEDSILGGKAIVNANVVAVKKTADVIKYVEENPGAIGIIGNNWLNDKRDTTNLTFNKNIRVMSVSAVDVATPANSYKPYQYYIWTGQYPFVRTIYALLNDPRRALPAAFEHFVESPRGQLIIMKAGLLPAYGNINVRDVNVTQ